MPSTTDLMRQRFHELRDEIAAIESTSAPLREERDTILAQAAAIEQQAAPLAAQIKAAEAGLYEKKCELAMLSQALGGNTARA
jgi:hypothetical protein